MQSLDVAVVGGGPGGLAAALALRRACPDLTVKVFEGASSMSQKGAGVLVHVNGWRAMHAIKPEMGQRLYQNAIVVRGMNKHHEDGTPVDDGPPGPSPFDLIEKEHGHRPKLLSWHDIRMGF